ncbi:peptidoglycan-recognition protein SC2 [Caerostris extrusa]|uniref:Peptidoglycan-recognition protein SC2 n=1 Tax=Caerostris extrusa TaxID=172846 RepID=A0AAV4XZK5_CAEEX|nr:peptidoglycan-recognition protein SC2 [Caerostris extrusa]
MTLRVQLRIDSLACNDIRIFIGFTMNAWILIFTFTFTVATSIKDDDMFDCGDVNIVSRDQWRARNAMRVRKIRVPVNHIIILHTVTNFCSSQQQCTRAVQFVQDMHLDDRGWWDIAYNFLVGGDGQIYEGRGWQHTASFAINYNTIAYGVAFIGNFNRDTPSELMLNATQNFIRCGIRKVTYEIHGHRDVSCTESPGNNLYSEIRNWNNFKGGRMPNYHCKKLERPIVNRDAIND